MQQLGGVSKWKCRCSELDVQIHPVGHILWFAGGGNYSVCFCTHLEARERDAFASRELWRLQFSELLRDLQVHSFTLGNEVLILIAWEFDRQPSFPPLYTVLLTKRIILFVVISILWLWNPVYVMYYIVAFIALCVIWFYCFVHGMLCTLLSLSSTNMTWSSTRRADDK